MPRSGRPPTTHPGWSPDVLLALAAVADLAPDVVSVIDAEGVLLYNSRAAERIHGYPPSEMVGRNTMDWIHPEDRPAIEAAMAALLANPDDPVRVRYRFRHRDGSWTLMEATGQNRLADERVRGIIAVSRDLTPRLPGRPLPVGVGSYDPAHRRVLSETGIVPLTPVEARLLEYLASRPGQITSSDELLREVWGYGDGVRSRTVYATMSRLRAKLEPDPANPVCILNLPGHGYSYVAPVTSTRPPAR